MYTKKESAYRLHTLLIAMFVASLLSSCDLTGSVQTPAQSPSNPTPASQAYSNEDLLKLAAANMKMAKSYHLNVITRASVETTADGDVDVLNHRSIFTYVPNNLNQTVVKISNNYYLSTDGGKTASSIPPSSQLMIGEPYDAMWSVFNPADVDRKKDALKSGSPAAGQIDGVDTRHIVFNSNDLATYRSLGDSGRFPNPGLTIDVWIATSGKPLIYQSRIVSVGNEGGGSMGDFDITLRYSKFDEPLKIEAPILPTPTPPSVDP